MKRFCTILLAGVLAACTTADPEKRVAEGTYDGELNILMLADAGRNGSYDQRLIGEWMGVYADALGPEFVISCGDLFHYQGIQSTQDPLLWSNFESIYTHGELQCPWYGVLGNHDRTEPESNLGLLMAEMKNYGCLPLVNTVSRMKLGQTYIYVAGVDDYYNGSPDVAGVASQVSSKDFVIFAGHSPDLMPDVLSAKSSDGDNHWFDLALFGHTHGGQINLLGYTPFKSLLPEVGSRYMSGWLEESRAAILVSNGVGTSGAPVRLFAPPQVHLITLKRR